MKTLRDVLDRIHPHFDKGGKYERFHAIYEMVDTFLYTPGAVTQGSSHVRDAIDLKRIMFTVVISLLPCIYMAMYNTGLQGNLALDRLGLTEAGGWRSDVMNALGLGFDATSWLSNFVYGALYFIPVFLVTNIVGGLWEVLFASVRKLEINEGFLVTGVLFPLTLPPTIPLWQVAIGISFGVVIGKEVFGGTGKNFLNPALVARAFIFFAYPAQMTGDYIWTAMDPQTLLTATRVDGFSGATALSIAATQGVEGIKSSGLDLNTAFIGLMPGSMGETSKFACLFGALVLVLTGIGSWQIMVSMLIGAAGFALLLQSIGSDTNPLFSVDPIWHLAIGSLAFGAVFMATDPVSAAMTRAGKYIYGFLIGFLTIMVRVLNPAFPEGVMLAILFGNVCAPLIDYLVLRQNIKRRAVRTGGRAT
ncbi:NADH:ubiquinone reductase (Na(+)-transporting) subunit B [Oligoflexus tunisiensis]|uniref:NADH:ubiquinone reductase (Na(+)-transporting) subunit B n=1 Tax=Oligoflexus tunisiensis TaxID=708132 RepID=UPI000A748667|nr:NADH:ubiquinone reductase (Na(+)-transporting) subunit B [Oligoflexus tunisiensis]